MKAVFQRVASAQVDVKGRVVARIGRGLLVFLCAVKGDTEQDVDYLAKKVAQIRIFEDEGRMDRSVADVGGSILVVSQFTLAAATRKGNRPSFDAAEKPDRARVLYESFIRRLQGTGLPVLTGEFAAMMAVSLVNDGPVTILLDSRERPGGGSRNEQ